jgi:hypothetical protein
MSIDNEKELMEVAEACVAQRCTIAMEDYLEAKRATQPAPIPAQTGASFDVAWDSIDWDVWRMRPIKELVQNLHALTDEAKDAARYRHIRDTNHNGYDLRGPRLIGKWHVSRKMRESEGEYFFGDRLDAMIDHDIAAHINAGQAGKDVS